MNYDIKELCQKRKIIKKKRKQTSENNNEKTKKQYGIWTLIVIKKLKQKKRVM